MAGISPPAMTIATSSPRSAAEHREEQAGPHEEPLQAVGQQPSEQPVAVAPLDPAGVRQGILRASGPARAAMRPRSMSVAGAPARAASSRVQRPVAIAVRQTAVLEVAQRLDGALDRVIAAEDGPCG